MASVITPATLSVITAPSVQVKQQHVPNIDFRSLNYLADMPPGGNQADGEPVPFFYNGPSEDVRSVVEYVSVQNDFVPFAAPHPNASWTLDFPGPVLECSDMPSSFQKSVRQNIAQSILDNYKSAQTCIAWGYLAWTGMSSLTNTSLPFTKVGNGSWVLNSPSLFNKATITAPIATKPEQFYMVAMPEAMTIYQTGSHSFLEVCANLYSPHPTTADIEDTLFQGTPTMIQCQVHNATYRTSFEYTNGEPRISPSTTVMENAKLTPIDWVYGPVFFTEDAGKFAKSSCSVLNQIGEAYEDNKSCYFNESLLSTLSYQAIAQAFFDRIVGSVSGFADGNFHNYNTSVRNTVLAKTKELNFLNEPVPGSESRTAGSLQAAILSSNGVSYEGLVNNITGPVRPLTSTMESLFRDSVVSMISSKSLR